MDSDPLVYCREEDYVEFHIFPFENEEDEFLDKVYEDVNCILKSLTQSYIWHKDCLKVHKVTKKKTHLVLDSTQELPPHIYGVCHYGENIEDEWFIVYLVKEITRKITSVVAKVTDADGEFLLIEAANSLPSWANPNNCTNRVFFYKGQIYLIRPDNLEDIDKICVYDATKKINVDGDIHLASEAIQKDLYKKIDSYPDKLSQNYHQSTVYTPVGVAALLKEDPSLVSAAIHAYCNRDPIDMKVCRAMKYFPPEVRVNTSVKFTKCLYAMLMHNNFAPDRRTGWNLPLVNSPQYKSHSLGVKLACGFEILVSQANSDKSLEHNKAWNDYLQSLKKRNYFQDFLEGSKDYNSLFDTAKQYFINNLDLVKSGPKLGRKILEILNDITLDETEFRKNESLLPNDNDDKWLFVDPKELENMMQERYGKKKFCPLSDETEPSSFSKKISEFLEHTSSIDGVEFPEGQENVIDTCLPTRPKRGIKTKKGIKKEVSFSNLKKSRSPSPANKTKIDFDADQFSSAIQNILDLVIPEDSWNLDSESDISEYGSNDELETNIFDLDSSEQKDKDLIIKYMKKMDSELTKTDLAKSFETTNTSGQVDIEKNALKNISQSHQEEMGGTGPAGCFLGPLGYTKYDHFSSIDEEVD